MATHRSALGFSLMKASTSCWHCFSASSSVARSAAASGMIGDGARLTVHVDERQVRARVDHTLANDQAEAAGAASDEADVAIEREAGERRLDVLTGEATDGLGGRQLVLLGVLDLDVRVGSRVLAGLVTARRHVVEVARGGEGRAQGGGSSRRGSYPAEGGSEDAWSGGHCEGCDVW